MKSLHFFLITCLISLFVQCKSKEVITPAPTGSISFSDKGQGLFAFVIDAANATEYKWTFGDGESSTEVYPQHKYAANGDFTVRCTLKGAGGQIVVSKTVNVRGVLGAITFWSNNAQYPIIVSVAGRTIGTISANYTSTPDCGADQTAWTGYTLNEGNYNFTAKENRTIGARTWSGTVTVLGGGCSKMQLNVN